MTTQPGKTTSKPSYTLDEAAEKLGVSRRTVERAVSKGRLPSYKFEGSRRIKAEVVEKIRAE